MAEESQNTIIGLLRLVAQTGDDQPLSQSLAVVAKMAALVSRSARVGVFLEDPESGCLRLVASYGLETDDSSRVLAIAADKEWSLGQKSLFIPRGGTGASLRPDIPPPFNEGSLWVGLYSEGKVIGRLVVQGGKFTTPDEATEEFLRLIGVYAGGLVARTRLNEVLQRRLRELTILYEIGRSLSSSLDVSRILKLVVDGVVGLTGCESCSIMLLDDGVLRIAHARGLPEEVVKNTVRRLGEGISGRVAQTGKPVFVRDVLKEHEVMACRAARYRSPSLICVPLKARGRVLGVLNANDKKTGDFTPEDFNLVTVFASHAAIAIDNASLHAQLWKTSITDGLTQTYVRTYVKEQLDSLVQRALEMQEGLGVIMVDLDHFKDINDRYGHQAGDEVLRQVSELLRRAVRAHDLVARYGGEEFVLVLPDCAPHVALLVAERIRQSIEKSRIRLSLPSRPGSGETLDAPSVLKVTASFGVAVLPIDAQDSDSLIRIADEHLYVSKQTGRNRVSCSKSCREAARAGSGCAGARTTT